MSSQPSPSSKPLSLPLIGGLLLASAVANVLPRPKRNVSTPAAAAGPPAATQTASPVATPAPAEPAVAEPQVRKETIVQVVKNVFVRIGHDNLMLVAAGCAFYGLTAIFPAIAAFVSIFGLFADPHGVHAQIQSFSTLLPPEALKLLLDAVDNYVGKDHSAMNVALLVSVGLAIWSAKAGMASLMTGLNIVNEQPERRGFFQQQFIGLSLTLGAIIFAATAFAAVALLPAIIGFLPLDDAIKRGLQYGRWPLLAVVLTMALAVLYRFGPSREHPRWRWITWGASIATVLWLIGSAGFSVYVSNFASYDKTYGSLAAPVILLLWFWVSALVVLIGAEVDAELEYGDGRRARPIDDSKAR